MSVQLYGRVEHDGQGHWLIRCEPFVRTRLKRVFPRVPQQAGDSIKLSATPANSRELAWFLERYPMAVDNADMLQRQAAQHVDEERRIVQLLQGYSAPQDIRLNGEPRAYQAVVPQYLDVRRGLLLADDLGLGKTVSAICCMATGERLPAVVVCDAHLTRQWAAQLRRFLPQAVVHVVQKGTVYPLGAQVSDTRQGDLLPPAWPDVVVISYHKLRGWADELAGRVRFAVFDECQALRSPGTLIYAAARHLAGRAAYRLGLSATPIHNYGGEFYWVLDVLMPDVLGGHDEFLREFCRDTGNGKHALTDPEAFGAWLARDGLMLRRRRQEVGRELPELSVVVQDVDTDGAALRDVQGDAVALAQVIVQHNEQFRGQKMRAAGEFDQLMRQATGIAKAPFVVQFVKLLLESGEQVILFGWHRAVYDIWLEGLAAYRPAMFTGSETAGQKEQAKAAFLSGEARVLIMSLRSGRGVDELQAVCSVGVIGELDWSPAVLWQCCGRFHRDGQGRRCLAYVMVSESGSDPIMVDVLGIKRDQAEGVLNPAQVVVQRSEVGADALERLAREVLQRAGRACDAAPAVGSPVESSQ